MPWTIAGLWSEWTDQEKGELNPFSKKQLPPEQEDKRSLVHIASKNWTRWLTGNFKETMELLTLPSAEFFDQTDVRRTDTVLSNLSGRKTT